jgi:hypothetical protein
MPQTFTDVIELLIPELRRRGIFWGGYAVPGATYRENVYEKAGQAEPPPDHPAAAMIWRAPEINGAMSNGVNGFTNGHVDDGGLEEVDPIAMQLG